MTQALLGRVHRELLDVLNSINQDKIHHDGDDFHELLNDVEKALAQTEQEPVRVPWSQALESVWAEQEQALCDLAEDGVCETLDCPNHPIGQEPVATVTSETGADITMSWWHEPALPIGTKLYTHPPQRKPLTDDLYNELLFAVGNKCPNETRHQTALRYILQAEKGDEKAAHGIKENT